MDPAPEQQPRKPFFTEEVDELIIFDDTPESDPAVWQRIQADIWKRRGRKPPIDVKPEQQSG